MTYVEFFPDAELPLVQKENGTDEVLQHYIAGKRRLSSDEITHLQTNNNRASDWNSVYVTDDFNPDLVRNSEFHGIVVVDHITRGVLKYHDLALETGIYDSVIISSIIGADVAIRNVKYLANYRIGNHVILFNIDELTATDHPKFGNGILKEGEPESDRVYLEVANENGGRKILPFEEMIPADAFLWSRYRDDRAFQQKLIEITESKYSKKRGGYGWIGDGAVVKNTLTIKDVLIGEAAYIKGASKLKNITILSSRDEPSQIGEGVEMVNGILGYNSKVFYQAVAVRFVIGRNCQLKYGARLLNSVLGDNSTISCCEILNNIIFPFHEQHHNTSFLIAATIMGQSNIAAGATVGSNHNSRSPDGEIVAGRGFWPGLCSDFKHNSKFASFTLVAKGSYQHELNIIYPFALIANDPGEQAVQIMPAYWFLYNMYAMARNSYKFKQRDKRKVKVQHIETEYLAPDTVGEILVAMERLAWLTGEYLAAQSIPFKDAGNINFALTGKQYLEEPESSEIMLYDMGCMKKYGAKIIKPVQAYREYKKIAEYFAVKTIFDYFGEVTKINKGELRGLYRLPLFTTWINLGGQIIPDAAVHKIIDDIKNGTIDRWEKVHQAYDASAGEYSSRKARYAVHVLETIFNKDFNDFSADDYSALLKDTCSVAEYIYESSYTSRQKDYDDEFRQITFAGREEMLAVIGGLDDNDFLKELRGDTEIFKNRLNILSDIILGKG